MRLWLVEISWYSDVAEKSIVERGITIGKDWGEVADRIDERFEYIEWMRITPVHDDFFFADDIKEYATWIERINE